jgi:hypothetical protein
VVVGLSLCAMSFASASTNDVGVDSDIMFDGFAWGASIIGVLLPLRIICLGGLCYEDGCLM